MTPGISPSSELAPRLPWEPDEQLLDFLRQLPSAAILGEAPSGRILFANERVGEIWQRADVGAEGVADYGAFEGYDADGRRLRPEDWPLARAIATGERVEGEEVDFVRGDGSRGVMEIHAAPVRDDDGRIVAGVVLFTDVTRRRRQEERQRFLAEAGRALGASLEPAEMLRRLAELAVPGLADWCSIDLTDGAGRIENAAIAHVDPERVALAHELIRRYPHDPDAEVGVPSVIRSGRAELIEHLDDALLVRLARDEEHLSLLRGLGLRSAALVPLTARGRTLGALTLVAAGSKRRYEAGDLVLLEELAGRAALAIDNAQLYQEQARSRADAEQLAGRLQRLQQIVDATLAPASLDELLPALLERLRDVLGTDSATILILDEQEQALVIRASLGLPDAVPGVRVPLGPDPTGGILGQRAPWVLDDPRRAGVLAPVLEGGGIATLAGVPLEAGGKPVGVLHVGARERRTFSEDDLQLLRLVASRAAVAIERTRLHEREHRIAETLQRSLLPETLPVSAATRVAARYHSGSADVEVGGDWYDLFELEGGRLGVVVGDVVGRGIRAAVAMGRLRSTVRAYALEGLGPAEVLARLNRLAAQGEDAFATVVYLVLDPVGGHATIASAGHPPPLVRRADGPVEVLEHRRSLPIGAIADPVFEETEVVIPPGSTLLLYTDGLVERRREGIDARLALLREVLAAAPDEPEAALDHVLQRMGAGGEQTDDVVVVAVELVPRGAERLSLRLPASAESLASVRGALGPWLERHGADRAEAFDVVVAACEACANAVEHPLHPAVGEIELEAELRDGEVWIAVRDSGRWREPRERSDRGRGIGFMHELMEHVEIRPTPGHGTQVVLRRRLERNGRPA